ncbi:hypothetical protein B0H14DRAFT_3478572 [Mycena olivaceomarginata]|nr:hypothetical protein B0H14DRAFT_3478572 [Mycena olivaceomarginata]
MAVLKRITRVALFDAESHCYMVPVALMALSRTANLATISSPPDLAVLISVPTRLMRSSTLVLIAASLCRRAVASLSLPTDDLVPERPSRTCSAQMRIRISSRVRLGARAAPPDREYRGKKEAFKKLSSSTDYDSWDALVQHLFKKVDAKRRLVEALGGEHLCLRVKLGHFRVFPYENPYLVRFEAAVRALNPLVAIKFSFRSTAPQHPHLRSFCGDTLIESRFHFCAVCLHPPPLRWLPHDVRIPLLLPYPPLLLRAHHLASVSPRCCPVPAHLVDINATPIPARHVPATKPSSCTRFRIASNAAPCCASLPIPRAARARIQHGTALVNPINPAGVLTTASHIVPLLARPSLYFRRVQTPHPALASSPIPSIFTFLSTASFKPSNGGVVSPWAAVIADGSDLQFGTTILGGAVTAHKRNASYLQPDSALALVLWRFIKSSPQADRVHRAQADRDK